MQRPFGISQYQQYNVMPLYTQFPKVINVESIPSEMCSKTKSIRITVFMKDSISVTRWMVEIVTDYYCLCLISLVISTMYYWIVNKGFLFLFICRWKIWLGTTVVISECGMDTRIILLPVIFFKYKRVQSIHNIIMLFCTCVQCFNT